MAEPYSLDTDLATFSADERADIYSTWQRVAEDFAPFAINVTTKDPGFDAIDRADANDPTYGTRVAITSTATGCGCGGVAYVGVFDRLPSGGRDHGYNQPAFVYTEGAKFAAEAASHEAGHTLGLSHDGGSGTEYYSGHGDWAPIMGVGYHKPITQWSKGEYAGATNTQDDFLVSQANGGTLRSDAGGGSLPLGTPVIGAIETEGDSDTFTLDVASGPVTVVVAPSLISPNLDVQATVTGGSFDNPSVAFRSGDVVGGLGATATLTEAGSYTITVGGTGFLSAVDAGYSAYGSLGGYTVTASAGPVAATPVPSAPSLTASLAGEAITLRWPDVAGETSYQLERYSVAGGALTFSRTQPIAADRLFLTDAPGAGTWRYRLAAVNPSGASAWTGYTADITVAAPRKGGGRK